MQVEDFLESSARLFPAKIALVSANRRFTYLDIKTRANRMAHSLRREGVVRGDRVMVCLENSVETVVSIFAILKSGAVFVVVNPTTKLEKLVYILKDCGAKAFITDAGGREVFHNSRMSPRI